MFDDDDGSLPQLQSLMEANTGDAMFSSPSTFPEKRKSMTIFDDGRKLSYL